METGGTLRVVKRAPLIGEYKEPEYPPVRDAYSIVYYSDGRRTYVYKGVEHKEYTKELKELAKVANR